MISLSRHAERRCQQRGVPKRLLSLILDHADLEKPIGDGCTLVRVSREQAGSLKADDRILRFAVIWSDERAQVVTVLPLQRSAVGRRYRTKQ